MDHPVDNKNVIEVELTDINKKTYNYWIKKSRLDRSEDEVDAAIALAKLCHNKLIGSVIPEDDWSDEDDPKIYATACEPFTRYEGEFIWVT